MESFSASGSRVHTPFGPRKSGMPLSVEMPAPVSTVMREAAAQPVAVRPALTPSTVSGVSDVTGGTCTAPAVALHRALG